MLDLGEIHHVWAPHELKEMLQHQLSAPLQVSLGTQTAEISHQLKVARRDPLLTLEQLLNDPQPPIELLKQVKQFAKMCLRDRENPLPSEIVMLLYYSSIAAGMVRLNHPISELPPAALKRGMGWLAEQQWVTEDVRALLEEGFNHIVN
jgi:hypothetical protein